MVRRAATATTRADAGGATGAPPPRPQGGVLWVALTQSQDLSAVLSLIVRMRQQGDGFCVVLTGDGVQDAPLPKGVFAAPDPSGTNDAINGFLAHWRPTVGLWVGPVLVPRLIRAAQARNCRMFGIHIERQGLVGPGAWLSGRSGVLNFFSDVFPADDAAHRHLRATRLRHTTLHAPGHLSDAPLPLHASSDELEWIAGHLAGRPVWLAARLAPEELDAVLRAHRNVSRLSHRLLLFLSPRPECKMELIIKRVEDMGLRCLLWDDMTLPDDNTQVVCLPDPDMLGVLYRLSPISFLGGSLASGTGGTDPLEAAVLGTAIIHGPNVRNHLAAYERLARARAARVVTDAGSLAATLSELIAPDAQATMAHAAWALTTEGAALTDALVDLILEALDMSEAA